MNEAADKSVEIDFDVTEINVSPAEVRRANSSPFLRYVNVNVAGNGPVSRVKESSLFDTSFPTSSNSSYRLGTGDTITVRETETNADSSGIVSRTTAANNYLIDDQGSIELVQGRTVALDGLTLREAKRAIERSLLTVGPVPKDQVEETEFPVVSQQEYEIGPGDIIRISRLIVKPDSNGGIAQSVEETRSVVGPDGVVSLLELGDVELGGLTLPEARSRVSQQAIRVAAGTDIGIEIEEFRSQSALVTGDFGSRLLPISNQSISFDRLLVDSGLAFGSERDYLVTLERNGEVFQMRARRLLMEEARDKFRVVNGDRIRISSLAAQKTIQVELSNFGSQSLTFVRVRRDENLRAQTSQVLPVDFRGLDLRTLLSSQNVDVNRNQDLIVRVYRDGRQYKLSAQSILLDGKHRNARLAPGDHVVVEDIAYVGDNALLVGELRAPRRLPVNRETRTSLAEALFGGGVFGTTDADFRHVYVLRGENLKYTAYHFDITNVLNLSLAEDFELRPGDIMFVRTRPLAKYNRALAVVLTFLGSVKAFEDINE